MRVRAELPQKNNNASASPSNGLFPLRAPGRKNSEEKNKARAHDLRRKIQDRHSPNDSPEISKRPSIHFSTEEVRHPTLTINLIQPMFSKLTSYGILALALFSPAYAQEKEATEPAELEILKSTVGTWDAAIKVWPAGLDAEAVTMKAVETNEAHGKHWLSSDFISEFQGQKMKVHTIVGYDLDQKKLVGTIIDHGPYAATMAGEFDEKTKTIHWTTKAKTLDGQPMIQKSSVTYKSDGVRHLIMRMKNPSDGEFTKFMEIMYTKRK